MASGSRPAAGDWLENRDRLLTTGIARQFLAAMLADKAVIDPAR
jgi:hypothetical protein